jgi:hypothetical protein
LSLSVLFGLMAPTALAEGNRSLGVAVMPVGAFWLASSGGAGVPAVEAQAPNYVGYTAEIDWQYQCEGSHLSVGGHFGASAISLDATPLSVRFVLWPNGAVQPYLGLGASLMIPTGAANTSADTPLRFGGEASGGVQLRLGKALFLAAEGRYQSFSTTDDPFSEVRQVLLSAHAGAGFRF